MKKLILLFILCSSYAMNTDAQFLKKINFNNLDSKDQVQYGWMETIMGVEVGASMYIFSYGSPKYAREAMIGINVIALATMVKGIYDVSKGNHRRKQKRLFTYK